MGLFDKKEKLDANKQEETIATYTVVYKGGLAEYPKSKVSGLKFLVFPDRFEIQPTNASKWFTKMILPHDKVADLKIVERQVNTFEGLAGGLDSRQLNQRNNINIEFVSNDKPVILRLEMITGFTVMGQAVKCRELEDRLSAHGIRQKFRNTSIQTPETENDMVKKIKQLSELRDSGVLTEEEFVRAKSKLLE